MRYKNLPSLFESDKLVIETGPAAAIPLRQKTPELDADQGKKNRDKGIKKAITHADEINPDWGAKAYNFLLNFLNNHNGPFMCEEVRVVAEKMGFPEPPTKRSWGAIITKAVKAELIKRAGYSPVRNKKANRTPASVWLATKNFN